MESLALLIGNTPLIKADHLIKKYQLSAKLYLKVEKYNLSGSVKDRIVYYILKKLIEQKRINQETTIIEATSGNTGISIACLCCYLKLSCIIVMPETASIERTKYLKSYRARIIYSPASEGMLGAKKVVNEYLKTHHNVYSINQFANELGVLAHYETTGKEIYQQVENVDIFISGIGTGTTFSGCSKYLKEQNPNTLCVGVLPKGANILNGEKSSHQIEGIGPNFVPSTLDQSLIDEIYEVSAQDALFYTKELLEEGLFCGISSGAALKAGIDYAKRLENQNKTIVVILPDGGERYFSKQLGDEKC